MVYTPMYPGGWHDDPIKDSPESAAAFTHIEGGIVATSLVADAAAAKAANLSDLGNAAAARSNIGADIKLTPTAVKTAAYTAVSGDLVRTDATAGTFTVTLPAASAGAVVAVKKMDSSATIVTIAAAGTDTIDGAATVALRLQNEARTYVASAGVWVVGSGLNTLASLDARYAGLVSGVVPTAQLGSGSASGTTFLRGDQTWGIPAGGGSSGTVTSVATTDATIAIGGTPTVAPTIGVGVIPESKVTNLVADLAAKAPTSRLLSAGTGLTGGGDLTADRMLAVAYGTAAGTAVVGNDSRLSDARSPSGTAGGDLAGTYPNPTVPSLATKVPTTRLITAGSGLTGGGDLTADRTLAVVYGSAAGTVAQGNDTRLADSRTPTGTAGGDLVGTYPNPTLRATLADPAAATAGLRTLGTGVQQAAGGTDSRIVGAAQVANNLSDLANIPTALTSLGLSNVTNTSDANKPVSIAQQTALDLKAAKAANLSDLANTITARGNLGAAVKLAPTAIKTAAYTAVSGDLVRADASGGTFTVTLPAAVDGAVVSVKKTDSSSAVVTIAAAGADTIDGSVSTTVKLQNETRVLVGSAGLWVIGYGLNTLASLDLRYAPISLAPSGDATGATDLVSINAAITAVNALGGGIVALQAGTFWVNSPVIPRSHVALRGAGVESTIIKLAAATNTDVLQGANFSTLSLTGASTWAASGINDSEVSDLTIDGNRTNQTGASWGIRLYGYNWILKNLDVRNCFTDGLWTEWGALSSDAPATTDGSESFASNVKSHHNGRHGWMFLGPSDSRLFQVMAFKNNQAAGPTSIGFWALQDNFSNILTTDASMNGVAVSGFTGTFNIPSTITTELYASSGTLRINTSGTAAIVNYTGKTATSFTGCTVASGTGTFVTGNTLVTTTKKFITAGMQMTACHVWSNDHTWACVVDSQNSQVNCHWEGARYGQLLIRNSCNQSGGFVYDFSPIATGCGIQLGDDGNTLGLPISEVIAANACNIQTRVSSILGDTVLRASLRWVSCSQSRVELQNVVKTTGVYTTTVAAASNGVDISTWTGAGTLTVASTNQIPDGPGVISVVTSSGTYNCSYTGNNVAISSFRASGTQFTGLTVLGSPPVSSLLSTGAAVSLQNIGTFAYSGAVDASSRLSMQSNGPSTAVSTASSIEQGLGARAFDVGTAANAFRLKNNTVDQLNLNTSSKQLQLPNGQQVVLFSDNYNTQQLKFDGNTGLVTGPLRGGKPLVFPGAAWVPGDHGLVTWNGDPAFAAANSIPSTPGTVYHVRVHCPTVFTATNLIIYVVTGGSGLTAGQCFAGLCNAAGTLIASTADLSSGAISFASGGSYTFPLSGGPFTNQAAGDYTICFFFNGTTGPSIARFGNVAGNLPNVALASPNLRHFTDSTNTGRTTSLPTTIGTQTANGIAFFAGIS